MATHMTVAGRPHEEREAGNQEAMDDEESKGQCALVWVVSMSTSIQGFVVVHRRERCLRTPSFKGLAVVCSYQRTEKLRNARHSILYMRHQCGTASVACYRPAVKKKEVLIVNIVQSLFTRTSELRVPLYFGVLEYRHHTHWDKSWLDNGQCSKSPENLVCVQGRIPHRIIIERQSAQTLVYPAR